MLRERFIIFLLLLVSLSSTGQKVRLLPRDVVGVWQIYKIQDGDSLRLPVGPEYKEGILFHEGGNCNYTTAAQDAQVRIKGSKGRWKMSPSGKIKAVIRYSWQKVNEKPADPSMARGMDKRYGRSRKRKKVMRMQAIRTPDNEVLLKARTGRGEYKYYKKQ